MLADIQRDKHTHRGTDCNTPLSYRGGVTTSYYRVYLQESCSELLSIFIELILKQCTRMTSTADRLLEEIGNHDDKQSVQLDALSTTSERK